MGDQYIKLGPDDVIREGDIFDTPNRTFVMPVVGSKVSDYPNLRIKRLRSTVIRDAAISVLRSFYNNLEPNSPASLLSDEVWSLKEAIGISIEELRK